MDSQFLLVLHLKPAFCQVQFVWREQDTVGNSLKTETNMIKDRQASWE